ncbi:hypothetical protein JHK82_054939 [Glycine max]|nr:hypothetical protein JHK82_054939 [Glycine max]
MMSRIQLNGLKEDVATNTSLLKGFCIVGKSDETVLCAKGKLKDGETVSEEICRRCQLNGKVEATKEH